MAAGPRAVRLRWLQQPSPLPCTPPPSLCPPPPPAPLQRYCSPLSLAALPVLERRAGWARYSVHLGDFGGSYPPAAVQGCGGGGAGQLTTVEFRSAVGAGRQVVCLDMVRLLPGASSS